MKHEYKPGCWENRPNTSISSKELNKLSEFAMAYNESRMKPKYTNCKNCGAPLKLDKCEYCGTYY